MGKKIIDKSITYILKRKNINEQRKKNLTSIPKPLQGIIMV